MRIRKTISSIIFLAIILFCSKSFGQIGFLVGDIDSKNYYEEIPFKLIEGLPIIKVKYRGEVRDFMLDTGAQNIFFDDIDDVVNIKKTSVVDANIMMKQAQIVYKQNFELGSLKFTEQEFITNVAKDNFLKTCFGIDGLIGSNAFRNSIFKLDYTRNVLIITNDLKRIDLKDYSEYKMEKVNKNTLYPYVVVSFDADKKINISYLIDSGFTSSIDMNTIAYEVLNKYNGIKEHQKGIGTSHFGLFGPNKDEDLLRVKTVTAEVGKLKIENQYIRVSKSTDSKLGYEILKLLDPVFDLKKNKLYFRNSEMKFESKGNGNIAIIYRDGKTVVSSLFGKHMQKAKIGDEVIEIEGVAPKVLSLCDILINNPLKGKNTITLKDSAGKIFTISKQ